MTYKEYDQLKSKVWAALRRYFKDDVYFDEWFDHMYLNRRETLERMVNE
jgi:hypothetical protein